MSVDIRRKNGSKIILKTNSGKIFPLERIWGSESWTGEEELGINNRRYSFNGWIEIDKSLNFDKKIFEDIPVFILVKDFRENIVKYACREFDHPLPVGEPKSDNDVFGINGAAYLSYIELDDLNSVKEV